MHFSDLFTREFKQLENKYFWTGVVWEGLAAIAFGSIFLVLFFYKPEPAALSDSLSKLFGDGFTNSMFVLAPIFAKVGVVVLLATISGICMKIYGDYKRLTQEYRQKLLLANTLFNGHEIIKVYIGDKIDTAFVLPMVEQILEDPLKKLYSNKESKEDALGLVEKIMELGKKGKELGSEKAKGD